MKNWFAWIASFLLALGFGSTTNARLGFDKGNGGDGLLCSQRSPSHLLAEEVESEINWKIKLRARTPLAPADELTHLLDLLESEFPEFTADVRKDLDWVIRNFRPGKGIVLDDLDDDLIAWIPNDCAHVQVAIQTRFYVLVDDGFWSKMDPRSRQMLYSHEAIYRALERKLTQEKKSLASSEAVRMLNAYLWRDPNATSNFDIHGEVRKLGVTNVR